MIPLPVVPGKGTAAAEENFRHGSPESVNALLHVSHHKEVVSILGYGPEQGILYLVDVLVLVDHDLVKPGSHFPGRRSGGAFLCEKQPDSLVFQVAVIQEIPLPLFFSVYRREKAKVRSRRLLTKGAMAAVSRDTASRSAERYLPNSSEARFTSLRKASNLCFSGSPSYPRSVPRRAGA